VPEQFPRRLQRIVELQTIFETGLCSIAVSAPVQRRLIRSLLVAHPGFQ
jgi:hypothetical protein